MTKLCYALPCFLSRGIRAGQCSLASWAAKTTMPVSTMAGRMTVTVAKKRIMGEVRKIVPELWLFFQFQGIAGHAPAENFTGQFVPGVGRNVGRFLSG